MFGKMKNFLKPKKKFGQHVNPYLVGIEAEKERERKIKDDDHIRERKKSEEQSFQKDQQKILVNFFKKTPKEKEEFLTREETGWEREASVDPELAEFENAIHYFMPQETDEKLLEQINEYKKRKSAEILRKKRVQRIKRGGQIKRKTKRKRKRKTRRKTRKRRTKRRRKTRRRRSKRGGCGDC